MKKREKAAKEEKKRDSEQSDDITDKIVAIVVGMFFVYIVIVLPILSYFDPTFYSSSGCAEPLIDQDDLALLIWFTWIF